MKCIVILMLLLSSSLVAAVIETYSFEDEATRERYHTFVAELRCPKCQNQNLAGSNSPIAKDLRGELYRLLEAGYSDDQIVEFMVDRYGDFILYRPRFNQETVLLWMAPFIFLTVGLIGVAVLFFRQKSSLSDLAELDQAEQQRLNELLAQAAAPSDIKVVSDDLNKDGNDA
jgi:cytochrome c-type biogenesis protein CcmH